MQARRRGRCRRCACARSRSTRAEPITLSSFQPWMAIWPMPPAKRSSTSLNPDTRQLAPAVDGVAVERVHDVDEEVAERRRRAGRPVATSVSNSTLVGVAVEDPQPVRREVDLDRGSATIHAEVGRPDPAGRAVGPLRQPDVEPLAVGRCVEDRRRRAGTPRASGSTAVDDRRRCPGRGFGAAKTASLGHQRLGRRVNRWIGDELRRRRRRPAAGTGRRRRRRGSRGRRRSCWRDGDRRARRQHDGDGQSTRCPTTQDGRVGRDASGPRLEVERGRPGHQRRRRFAAVGRRPSASA